MVKGKKEKEDGGASSEEQASLRESKRLQDLAVSRGLLARSKANPSAPLLPTRTIRKCDGKDIVKRGNRKTKYLFAFPGLVAPIAGGKLGELTHLDSRNPILYIDFPQGRLKLFGTIVYPKNKYLTMHFVPGRGDIVCEDCFESIVVFPEAWWIGKEEDNPDELRLTMPSKFVQDEHVDFNFTAGAGMASNPNALAGVPKAPSLKSDPDSPVQQFQVERLGSPTSVGIAVDGTTLRRSSRKSAEKLNYTLPSSSDSDGSSDRSEASDYKRKGGSRDRNLSQPTSGRSYTDASMEEKAVGAVDEQKNSEEVQKEIGTAFASSKAEEMAGTSASKGSLKQATLTTFLTKMDSSNIQAPSELIEIEESSQKVASGGNKGVSERPRRTPMKKLPAESDDSQFSEENEQSSSSSDSDGKDVGSRRGTRRGRGRGRGRGTAKAATSGGRGGTPNKRDTRRRQSITEISSSDEDDRPVNKLKDIASLDSD